MKKYKQLNLEERVTIKVVGRVQHFSLNTTLKFMHLSCWMSIVQHDLQLNFT